MTMSWAAGRCQSKMCNFLVHAYGHCLQDSVEGVRNTSLQNPPILLTLVVKTKREH